MGTSGGPITQDNTSIEYYCTIFTFMESPVTKGVIWVGSDDGLVHVTRDGGKNWANVTPKELPEWSQINSIDASAHDPGTAYVAATMYKSDDFRPYLYKTTDYGKTWKKIVNGIPDHSFTRVVREDPNHKGLLIAGTEFGLYISFDDGENWKPFQLNLPLTPITDVAFQKREQELVVATQGRAFYVLDDVPLLYQLNDSIKSERSTCSSRRTPTVSARAGAAAAGRGGAPGVGQNPPGGAVVYYWLKDRPKGEVTVEFLDASGKLVKKFSSSEAPRPQARGTRRREENPVPRRPSAAPYGAGWHEPLRVESALSRRHHLPRPDHVGGQRYGAPRTPRKIPGAADRGRQDRDPDLRGEEGPAPRHHTGGLRQAAVPVAADSRQAVGNQ